MTNINFAGSETRHCERDAKEKDTLLRNTDFTENVLKIVTSHLRRSHLTIEVSDCSNYRLVDGTLNINKAYKALQDGAISIAEDGSICICGEHIPSGWDTTRIRRRLEDHLRKSASASEIIHTAFILGVKTSS
jgi:hypothetical protein